MKVPMVQQEAIACAECCEIREPALFLHKDKLEGNETVWPLALLQEVVRVRLY